MSSPTRSALIIGTSRGLGLVLAQELLRRGWTVIGTTRGPSDELDAVVSAFDGRLRTATLEMNDDGQLGQLREQLDGERFNLVFVNAAINRSSGSIAEVSVEEFIEVMVTNAFRPLRVLEVMRELMVPGGTVGIMSSEQGSVSRNDEDGFEVYKASKAALNQLTRSYATRYADDGQTKLLIDPGHNRTGLGGNDAPLVPSDSIPLVVDVLEANAGHGGLQFVDRNGAAVPW